jgi:chemotaxis receptor (MCP) glutamine deamidase CheD
VSEKDYFLIYEGKMGWRGNRYVGWDETKTGRNTDTLWTNGLSVCLAITLWSLDRNIGVMAHTMNVSTTPRELKPENLVDTLLDKIQIEESSEISLLVATLAGEGWRSPDDERQSSIVANKLEKLGIRIVGKDLSYGPGRAVRMRCDTGLVEVYRDRVRDC